MQREVWHDQKNKLRQQSWQSQWISKIKVKFVKDKERDNNWDRDEERQDWVLTLSVRANAVFQSRWEEFCKICNYPGCGNANTSPAKQAAEFTGLNKRWCWYFAQLSEKEVRERPLGVRIRRPGLASLSLSCWLNMQREGWRHTSRLEQKTELASLGSTQ